MLKKNSMIFLVLTIVLLCLPVISWSEAKYVFFMIGDGMSAAQRDAASLYLGRPTVMDSMAVRGTATTYCLDSSITDSAAAGTALATGRKTNSKVVSMDPSGVKTYETIAQRAAKKGMKVGIVSSISLDSATPACFYAHQKNRKDYYDIAVQIPKSGFHYFAGGGFVRPRGLKGDRPDVVGIIERGGYRYVRSLEGLGALTKEDLPVVAVNPILTGGASMAFDIDRREGGPSLAEFTAKGIEILDGPEGFFLMVEGGKIDWACHANDGATAILDTLAFDQAVQVALEFQRARPNTLVVVTGDHETGGMSVDLAKKDRERFVSVIDRQRSSYEAFDEITLSFRRSTAGKGSLEKLLPRIEKAFGISWQELSTVEKESIRKAFVQSMKEPKDRTKGKGFSRLYGWHDPL
ncbi:MAG: alkaline phosphatase, partial [Dethiosulfovibrio sp.]|nr:alkaline phosphatase [Dethiosulfovibrio sp.]